jgi:hypothetical protein
MVTSRRHWIGRGTVIRHPLAKGVFLPFELTALGLFVWKLCSDCHAKFYSECELKSNFSALRPMHRGFSARNTRNEKLHPLSNSSTVGLISNTGYRTVASQ